MRPHSERVNNYAHHPDIGLLDPGPRLKIPPKAWAVIATMVVGFEGLNPDHFSQSVEFAGPPLRSLVAARAAVSYALHGSANLWQTSGKHPALCRQSLIVALERIEEAQQAIREGLERREPADAWTSGR